MNKPPPKPRGNNSIRAPVPRWQQPQNAPAQIDPQLADASSSWNFRFGLAQAVGSLGLLVIAIYGFFFSPLATQIELDLRSQAYLARQDLIDLRRQKQRLESELEVDRFAIKEGKQLLESVQLQIAQLQERAAQLGAQKRTLAQNMLGKTQEELTAIISAELDKYTIIARYSQALPLALHWVDAQIQYWDDHRRWLRDAIENRVNGAKEPTPPDFEVTKPWHVSWHSHAVISSLGVALLNTIRGGGVVDPLERSDKSNRDRSRILDVFFKEAGCAKEDFQLNGFALIDRAIASHGLRTLLEADAVSYRRHISERIRTFSSNELLVVCPQRDEPATQISTRATGVLKNIQSVRNQLQRILSP